MATTSFVFDCRLINASIAAYGITSNARSI
jgi:hypothetical protein